MSDPFIYEFLYRGSPAEGFGIRPPEWYVKIGQYVSVPGGDEPQLLGRDNPITPEKAASLGYSLEKIFETVNAEAIRDRDRLQSALFASEESLKHAQESEGSALAAAQELSAALDSLQRQFSEAVAELHQLRAERQAHENSAIEIGQAASREAEVAHASALAAAEEQAAASREAAPTTPSSPPSSD